LKKYLYNIDLRDKKEILRSVANGMQAGEKGLAAEVLNVEKSPIKSAIIDSIKS